MRKTTFFAVLVALAPSLEAAELPQNPAPESSVAISSPSTTSPAAAPSPASPKTNFNEMSGSLMGVDPDEQVLRMTVEGGVNVNFTYDANTKVTNGGSHLTVEDLNYGDKIVVRYIGKELNATEIERVSRAPSPFH